MRHRLPALLIAARNLRGSTHTLGPIVLRTLVVGVFFMALIFTVNRRGTQAAPGLLLLHWFGTANLWLIWVCGILLFPSVIVQEREQGTWILLRLAGVGPGSFLLGQSVAVLSQMLLVILTQVPFLLLAVALGGTSPRNVLATAAVLLAHALCVYALSLVASARARSATTATFWALVIVSPFTFVPDLLHSIFGPSPMVRQLLAHVTVHLPGSLVGTLRAGNATDTDLTFGLTVQLAIAVAAVICAWLVFAASENTEPARSPAASGTAAGQSPRFPAGLAAVRHLCQRFVTGGPRTWMLIAGLYVVTLGVTIRLRRGTTGRHMLDVLLIQGLLVAVFAAALGAWSVRHHMVHRTAPLLALARPDSREWLRGVRYARWRTLGVVMLSLAITYSMAERGPRHEVAAFVFLVIGAALLGDAVGERCAFTGVAAPWAISVLIMGGVCALMMAGGYIFQPRSAFGYFTVHAIAYCLIASSLARATWARAGRLEDRGCRQRPTATRTPSAATARYARSVRPERTPLPSAPGRGRRRDR